jgi:outer membrane cobalamin receptor
MPRSKRPSSFHSGAGFSPGDAAGEPVRRAPSGAALAVLVCLAPATAAPDAPVDADPARLETIVVVNTGNPRPIRDVVGTVTVVDRADAESLVATSPASLWRYVPGIEVESGGSRFPAQSLSIRGIGGNRVMMEVDGIPVQDRFVVGSFADAGRSLTDVDFIERIEVLHGPASSLYGSSAIGGVVSVTRVPLARARLARGGATGWACWSGWRGVGPESSTAPPIHRWPTRFTRTARPPWRS